MAGKSPVRATPEQVRLLEAKAGGSDRAEADGARSILLTLRGWTSSRIAEAFGVREDTVRLWRSEFMNGGVEALETRPLPGPEPVKTQAALRVAEPLLSAPVTIERVWRSLKYEDVYLKGYADGREAKAGISDWIIFYNERRLHQALGYRVPMAVWREGAPPKAYGHVDNANALTTCQQADQKQQQTEPLAA